MTRPLEEAERRLAETAAHLIAKAEEIKLKDTPEGLVEPCVLRLLAVAHIELLEQFREIHGRINQIARVAIDGALREIARQQGGIATGQIIDDAKTEGMLAAHPFVADLPRRPGVPPSMQRGPQVVLTPTQIAKLSEADLITLYCRVMNEIADSFIKHESYIVRLWDGMDGCWSDCTAEVSREEAIRYWAEKTDGGTRRVAFAEIDYYKVFPGGTRMAWDGSEGREMFQ